MKRILILVLMIMLIFSTSAVYGADNITVLVNGTPVVSDTPAVNQSGTIMLPFRAIFNALGVEDDSIKWNQSSQSLEVRSDGKYIFLVIGNTGALVNDTLITLNAAPYIENSRTLVPVRFVSEALGASVQWDKSTKTVTITKN